MDIILKAGATGIIELIPQEDGSIILRVNEGKKSQFKLNTPSNTGKPNEDVLREFCSKKKLEEGVDKKELLKFYNFYQPKAKDWKNAMDCEKLWIRWEQTVK